MTVEELVDELMEYDLDQEVHIGVELNPKGRLKYLSWHPVSLVSSENYGTDKDTVSIYIGSEIK